MKLHNYSNYFEEADQRKNDVVLDTSSVDIILKNKDLSNDFFDKIHGINGVAVVPFAAFSEVLNHHDTFHKFNDLYKQKNDLRIIWEPLNERIKREINTPIESNLYLEKDIDLYKAVDEDCYKKNIEYNKKLKTAWQENCKNKRSCFIKDHNLTHEQRNRKIQEILTKPDFFVAYMNNKPVEPLYWVLDWFENQYGDIRFPKEKIYSNRNRYKFINLLQCLMYINMHRSLLTGSSMLSGDRGDLFDMDIASFSAYSSCFISDESRGTLVCCLKKIKDSSDNLGFENKYEIYHKVENFINH